MTIYVSFKSSIKVNFLMTIESLPYKEPLMVIQ